MIKTVFKTLFWVMFLVLVAGNIYIFVSGIRLSDEINHYETEIKKVHQENVDLEKKVFQVQSLQYTASIAAGLDFTERSSPLVLENIRYALKK